MSKKLSQYKKGFNLNADDVFESEGLFFIQYNGENVSGKPNFLSMGTIISFGGAMGFQIAIDGNSSRTWVRGHNHLVPVAWREITMSN